MESGDDVYKGSLKDDKHRVDFFFGLARLTFGRAIFLNNSLFLEI